MDDLEKELEQALLALEDGNDFDLALKIAELSFAIRYRDGKAISRPNYGTQQDLF